MDQESEFIDSKNVPFSFSSNPSSPTESRSCKKAQIDESIETGNLKLIEFNKDFWKVANLEDQPTEFIKCKKCSRLLSGKSGGHRTVHKTGKCAAPMKFSYSLNPSQNRDVREAITSYVLKSGVSFNHVQSSKFREMIGAFFSISNPTIDLSSIKFPCSETIRKSAEAKADVILGEIADLIRPPIQRGEASLLLDFGTHHLEFLSSYIVFADQLSEGCNLRAIPLTFMPITASKSAETVFELLLESAERLKITEEELRNLHLVSDGAANCVKLGTFFKSATTCSCHVIQKVAERTCSPLKDQEYKFTKEELDHIRQVSEWLDLCGLISARLRRIKKKVHLHRLPVLQCETRWLTSLYCSRDVLEMYSQLAEIDDNVLRKYLNQLKPNRLVLIGIVTILESFEIPLKDFEATQPRLHHVAPLMYKMSKWFGEEKEKAQENGNLVLQAIAKSAEVHMDFYIQKTVTNTHLLSTFLCPKMRSMTAFPPEVKAEALRIVKEQMAKVEVPSNSTTSPTCHNPIFASIFDPPSSLPGVHSELADYQSMILSSADMEITVAQFWRTHSSRFPRLYKISKDVFCILSSETLCERAFSHLKNVFRSDRFSLDPVFVEKMMLVYLYINNFE